MAKLLNNQNKYEENIEKSNKEIDINPSDANAYKNRGNTYYKLQKFDQAILDYTQAININPQYDKAYYNRGNIYQKIEKI